MLSRIKECHKMVISVPILFPHPSLGTTDKPRAGTFSQILQFYLFFADKKPTTLKKPGLKKNVSPRGLFLHVPSIHAHASSARGAHEAKGGTRGT
jgi:hypothetical protein